MHSRSVTQLRMFKNDALVDEGIYENKGGNPKKNATKGFLTDLSSIGYYYCQKKKKKS